MAISNKDLRTIFRAAEESFQTPFYDLLPQHIRDNDPEGALLALMSALQLEANRAKIRANTLLDTHDPQGLNVRSILDTSPSFFAPEQFIAATFALNGEDIDPLRLNITELSGFEAQGSNYYNRFGIYVYISTFASLVGVYRTVSSYTVSGGVGTITLDRPMPLGSIIPDGTAMTILLCYPDRIFLPTEIVSDPSRSDGTNLPSQEAITNKFKNIAFPNLLYISNIDGYYTGWEITFLDGNNKGRAYTIIAYDGATLTATLGGSTGAEPQEGDWFKLTPPGFLGGSTAPDFYKDRYLRIPIAHNDSSYQESTGTQYRRVIRSEFDPNTQPVSHIAYVWDPQTGEGEPFDYPPSPESYVSVLDSFIPLSYLASQIGFYLDYLDPEPFQREQLRNAFNFYKLKGTRRGFESLGKAFGLTLSVVELGSNYRSSPPKNEVGPDAVTPAVQYAPWQEIDPFVSQGLGEDNVPQSYRETPDEFVVPSSDIRIFLSRDDPRTLFGPDVARRLIRKIEEVRPIHVEVETIGFLEPGYETVKVEEDTTFLGTQSGTEPLAVVESLFASPVEKFTQDPVIEAVGVFVEEIAYTEGRYDVRGNRFERLSFEFIEGNGLLRFDLGTIFI